jgi:hypothetical protein
VKPVKARPVTIPEFNRVTRGGAAIWISQSYSDRGLIELLADPDRLLGDAHCRIVKDQKKIKVGFMTVPVAGVPRSFYIKRYNAFSLRDTVRANLAQSGALRALRGARLLRQAGIPTVNPVAAVQKKRWGIVGASFFISEAFPEGKTVDAYWKEELQHGGREGYAGRLAFVKELALLFRTLHARQLYHGDLKDANILVAADPQRRSISLCLLDLESVRCCRRLSERRRIKNLVQLYRTLGRHVPRAQRLFFLKCYLGPGFADRHVKRQWIRRVINAARRVDQSKGAAR